MQDERLGLVAGELVRVGVDEERLGEQRVPGARGDDADAQPVRGIGAGERVDDVEVALLEVGDDLVPQPVEVGFGQRLVDGAPPDPLLRAGLLDDELVPRRAARVVPGVDDERPALGQAAVASKRACV